MTKKNIPTAEQVDQLLIDMHRDITADSPSGYDPTDEEIEAAYQEHLQDANKVVR